MSSAGSDEYKGQTYTFNILNAEGLCFEADGGMWILSDAEQKIYQFEKRQW